MIELVLRFLFQFSSLVFSNAIISAVAEGTDAVDASYIHSFSI